MSLTLKEIFEAVVLTELFPHSVIDIYVQVLQSDGGELEKALVDDVPYCHKPL